MKAKNIFLLLILLTSVLFTSCSKMNDLHNVYLEQGERVYVGRPDSVKAFPGINRVNFNYWVSDPKAKKMKIYWDNRLDSAILDITSSLTDEPGVFQIENLDAKNYNFEIVTYNDSWKNPSIPLEVLTDVYSEKYLSRLFPRIIEYATYITTDSVYVSFMKPTEKSIVSFISYINTAGLIVNKIVPNDTNFITLGNFKSSIDIHTNFLPFKEALDTLKSIPKRFSSIDFKLNKSSYKRWNPVGIPYTDLGGDWKIEKMWDNDYFGGKSYLVNKSFVTSVDRDGNILMVNGKSFPISRRRKEVVMNSLKGLKILQ